MSIHKGELEKHAAPREQEDTINAKQLLYTGAGEPANTKCESQPEAPRGEA